MINCKIIQDLLPLYCDKLTSEESNEEIEKHLRECEECSQIYDNMCAKEEIDININNPKRDIKPLKKINRSTLIKIIVSIPILFVVLFDTFIFMFRGFNPIRSEKLNMEFSLTDETLYSGTDVGNFEVTDVKEETVKMLKIQFSGDCIGIRTESNANFAADGDGKYHLNYELTFYPVVIPNEKTYGWGTTFREGDKLTVHCRDKDIVYDLSELAKELEENN